MTTHDRIYGHLGEVYDTFQTIKSELALTGNLSDKLCLAQLIETYRARHEIDIDTVIALLGCSTEEITAINQALSVEYADIWSMLKAGLLQMATQRNLYGAPDSKLHESHTRKAHHIGSYEHVEATVAHVMRANEQAEHSLDQVYLSVGMVRKIACVGEKTVKAYFTAHQDAIDAHNQQIVGIASDKHGENHNLLRAKYLQAVRKGVGEQFLARYGKRLVTVNGSMNLEKMP